MTSSRGSLLTSLRNADSLGPEQCGHKASVLGRLAVAGFAVPEGLVLTADALQAVLETAGLGAEATPQGVRAAGWPQTVRLAVEEIAAHFAGTPVAVRSSAAEEDLAGESYAGQYTSVLRVRGEQELAAAIRECWASGFASTVRSYRGEPAGPRLAVLVQPMVEADVAGVAFTADPITGDREDVLVSAVPGTAEQLAGGASTPDEWRVRGADGPQSTATPRAVSRQALTERQACAVAALARRVETELGGPQDVEWAMAGQRLLLLQARPITALPRAALVDLPPGTWVKEQERHPEPLTAFGASLAGPLVADGLTEMAASWGALIERFEARPVGGEPYMRVTPLGGDRPGPPPPWWLFGALARLAPPLRARMSTARRMLRPGMLQGALDDWENVHRPRVRDEHAQLAGVDLDSLDDAGLDEYVSEALDFLTRCMRLHFWLIPPYAVPVHEIVAFCHRELGWDDGRSLLLLAGTSTATVEPHRELKRIAALDSGADEELREWLRRYGVRCVNDDPGSPTLAERPDLVAAMVREAGNNARDGADSATQTRAETLAQARLLLADRPSRSRVHFEQLLARATRAYPVREDSAFWTGSMTGGLMRRALVEIGNRLTDRGLLHDPQEAAHLDLGTLRRLLRVDDPADPHTRADIRARVDTARAERAWASRHPGPPYHGPAPSAPPSFRGLPRAGRRLNEALDWSRGANQGGNGPHAGGPASTPEATLVGTPGSPGQHRGTVRVVLTEADFGSVGTGDVLVCATTDPAWSVLFGVAGALVTDRGGVLCHAAIVAREFGIPAVLATTRGTRVLRDGQQVTVDGDTGRVVLERDPAEPDRPEPDDPEPDKELLTEERQ